MYQIIIVIHVLLSIGIIGLILMQQGKGADAGASFGSGASGSVFGAQGAASFLSRSTAILASLFFITSLTLAILSGHKGAAFDLMSDSKKDVAPVTSLPEVPTVATPAPAINSGEIPLPAGAQPSATLPAAPESVTPATTETKK